MNEFGKILERNTCVYYEYVSVSFIKRPELISSVSTPHNNKLQVLVPTNTNFRCCWPLYCTFP